MTAPLVPSVEVKLTRPGNSMNYMAFAVATDSASACLIYRLGGIRSTTGKISLLLVPNPEAMPRYSSLEDINQYVQLIGERLEYYFGDDLDWVNPRINLPTRIMFYGWLFDPDILVQYNQARSRLEREHLVTIMNDAGIPEVWF